MIATASTTQNQGQKQGFDFTDLMNHHAVKRAPEKLTIYEILASKFIFYISPSSGGHETSRQILAGGTHSIPRDSNSNLKSLGFVILVAMFHPNSECRELDTIKQVVKEVGCLQKELPSISKYPFSQKFLCSDFFLIIASMLDKISSLILQDFDIFQILDVYAGYLELMALLLRGVLCRLKYPEASDFSHRLATLDTYAMLTEYFNLNCYVKNGTLFIFPDFHVFVSIEEEEEFIFGRYYDNPSDLMRSEKIIRENAVATIKSKFQTSHLRGRSTNLLKTSDVCSSKVFTPQFEDSTIMGFQKMEEKYCFETPQQKKGKIKQSINNRSQHGNLSFDDVQAYTSVYETERETSGMATSRYQAVSPSSPFSPSSFHSPSSPSSFLKHDSNPKDKRMKIFLNEASFENSNDFFVQEPEQLPEIKEANQIESDKTKPDQEKKAISLSKIKQFGLSSGVFNLSIMEESNPEQRKENHERHKNKKVIFYKAEVINFCNGHNYPKQPTMQRQITVSNNLQKKSHAKVNTSQMENSRDNKKAHKNSSFERKSFSPLPSNWKKSPISRFQKGKAQDESSLKKEQRSLSHSGYKNEPGAEKTKKSPIPAFLKKQTPGLSPKSEHSKNSKSKSKQKLPKPNSKMISTYYTSAHIKNNTQKNSSNFLSNQSHSHSKSKPQNKMPIGVKSHKRLPEYRNLKQKSDFPNTFFKPK